VTQADLLTPREARADGMERALRGADERIKRIARAAIVLCIEIGRPFTTDQVEAVIGQHLAGVEKRFLGPLMKEFEGRGEVTAQGMAESDMTVNHGRVKTLWIPSRYTPETYERRFDPSNPTPAPHEVRKPIVLGGDLRESAAQFLAHSYAAFRCDDPEGVVVWIERTPAGVQLAITRKSEKGATMVEQSRVADLLGSRVRWVGDSPLPERWERQGYVGTVHTVEVQ